MSEIILDPNIEIRHDLDRELYWRFRQVVDSKFLKAINQHLEEKEHCYHVCFNQYLDVRQLSLKRFIDSNEQFPPRDILEQVFNQVGDELVEVITNMLAVYRECERRGIKLK